MNIQSFGYLGIQTPDLADWPAYATRFLGMQSVETGSETLSFRMDDRAQRLFVERPAGDFARFLGWELADAAALDQAGAALERAGVRVLRGTRSHADRRRVRDLLCFSDPAGNRIELFHGPELAAAPFRPGRAISGFRTGPLGLGHVVLTVERIDAVLPFYRDVLGFRLSDYALRPFKAYFLHVNPRHHSLALVETGRNGLHHLMVELFSLDDVGQGYDIAQTVPDQVAVTLGRHTNDFMTSFYARSPADFMVEYGWGGRDIDVATWTPCECADGPSLWGHERNWLPPEKRAEARALRMGAAARGLREPVQVLPGNHVRLAGNCPWWDATIGKGAGSAE
jgi:2,3-dihydroxybiphenyl 1,2-dioxygenase